MNESFMVVVYDKKINRDLVLLGEFEGCSELKLLDALKKREKI